MRGTSVGNVRHHSALERAIDLVLPSGDAVQKLCEQFFPGLVELLRPAQRRAEKLTILRAAIDDEHLLPVLFREAQRQHDAANLSERGVAMGPLGDLMDDLMSLWTDRDPVERAFARLEQGWFAIDAPSDLPVGESGSIGVSAIRGLVHLGLLKADLRYDAPTVAPTLLAKRLRVELVPHAPAAVRVRSLSPEEQPVFLEEITLWEWVVTPLRSCERLRFSVAAANQVRVGDQVVSKNIPLATIELGVTMSSPAAEADSFPLSRSTLRKVLYRVLPSDPDLDAFCLDHFPEVYGRFTSGMERVQKYNLLLEHCVTSDILAALHTAHPRATGQHLAEVHKFVA